MTTTPSERLLSPLEPRNTQDVVRENEDREHYHRTFRKMSWLSDDMNNPDPARHWTVEDADEWHRQQAELDPQQEAYNKGELF